MQKYIQGTAVRNDRDKSFPSWKIESGVRRPGIDAYYKIMDVLGVEMVLKNEGKSVQERCAARAQEIFMNSTERQAAFMIHVLESMAERIDTLT